ncbi:translesion error-prone DNA polymerase V autoproteolytic subunit [uncultured Flavobacterium sp.]|uniref:LexA family protein n=1 Tax=uncultured Flavobacterium sp. TaxID=165435 RepID=UPI0025D35326|nr:translesion error-prone DNA polymerase V autoproteolytic subunit [uncultured Flavobacterium sp.]
MKKMQPLNFFRPDTETNASVPFISHRIAAGFASPAQDFLEERIDLNKELVKNPLTTFYITVSGNSMINAGIADGDLLIADRSLEPADGKVAICLIDGDFTVKRLKVGTDCIYLMPENPAYKPLKVTEDNNFTIWGIVTYVVRSV